MLLTKVVPKICYILEIQKMRNIFKFFEFETITMREAILELHKYFKVLQEYSDAKIKFL